MCATKNCRKIAKKGNYCASCSIVRFSAKHPEKYAYFVLRNNAKRRGKVFTISFDEFLTFITKTKYMKKKGIEAQSLHIDRIDESKGYEPGNLQMLTNTQNIKKRLIYEWDQKKFHVIKNKTDINEEYNYPF